MKTLILAAALLLQATGAPAPRTAPQTAQTAAPNAASQAGTADRPIVIEQTEIDRQVMALSAQLRCPVCQGLSLADSPSELSQEMRGVVRSLLEEGKSPEEVKAYFVSKYGEWILLEPEPTGFNMAVYLLPILALLGGAVLVVVLVKRWSVQNGP